VICQNCGVDNSPESYYQGFLRYEFAEFNIKKSPLVKAGGHLFFVLGYLTS